MLPSTRVWGVAEIKLRIISQVDDLKDLASLLRVEKKGMALVAGFLYHEVTFEHARSGMSKSAARQKMYEDAITILNCRKFSLTPSMIHQLPIDTDPFDARSLPTQSLYASNSSDSGSEFDPYRFARTQMRRALIRARVEEYIATYRPEVVEALLPSLRKQFPGLRKLIFGREYHHLARSTSWVVDLDRDDRHQEEEVAMCPGGGKSGTGRIQHIQTREHSLNEDPPSALPDICQAPAGYKISSRWDLDLSISGYYHPTRATEASWVAALHKGPLASGLYRAVNLDRLPITVTDLAALYQRQIDAGHTERLQRIIAPYIHSLDLPAFRTFAEIASTSLTHLILTDPYRNHGSSVHPTIYTGLIRIIAGSLPHLVTLEFRLQELEEADRLCEGSLRGDLLCQTGTINHLRIHTDNTRSPPFNALRLLSPILAKNAVVCLLSDMGLEVFLTRYLKYLKEAHWTHRPYLATVNFAWLGIYDFESLSDLTFDKHGLPEHELVTVVDTQLARSDAHAARRRGPVLSPELASKLQQARNGLDEATRELIILSYTLRKGSEDAEGAEEGVRISAEITERLAVQQEALQHVLRLIGEIQSSSLRSLLYRGI